jgi:hypothetical protein
MRRNKSGLAISCGETPCVVGPAVALPKKWQWPTDELQTTECFLAGRKDSTTNDAFLQPITDCHHAQSCAVWYSAFGKSLCTYKTRSSIEITIVSKYWIKQLHILEETNNRTDYTTPLFYVLAPTCFGNSLLSSGSLLDNPEVLEIQTGWVVYHITCGYATIRHTGLVLYFK